MLNFPLPVGSKAKSSDIIPILKDLERSFILRELDTSTVSLRGQVEKVGEEVKETLDEFDKLGDVVDKAASYSEIHDIMDCLRREDIEETIMKAKKENFDIFQAAFNSLMKLENFEEVINIAELHNEKIDDIAEERLIRPGKPNLKIKNEYQVSIIRK